uniref:Uncharacterized protein n=1 Tax=Anguilla anguilla TaxID=7936 RepID=A0A0E9U911_ANGAN
MPVDVERQAKAQSDVQ